MTPTSPSVKKAQCSVKLQVKDGRKRSYGGTQAMVWFRCRLRYHFERRLADCGEVLWRPECPAKVLSTLQNDFMVWRADCGACGRKQEAFTLPE